MSVELLFMPSVYAPCPTCHGARYNAETLQIRWHGLNIAEVLGLTVDTACTTFGTEPQVLRPLQVLRDIGLGYLRLGQPATELSGGEAQRIKLATELQRLLMWTACCFSLKNWCKRATPWSSWNTTCAWSLHVTGSSTWGPEPASREDAWYSKAHLQHWQEQGQRQAKRPAAPRAIWHRPWDWQRTPDTPGTKALGKRCKA